MTFKGALSGSREDYTAEVVAGNGNNRDTSVTVKLNQYSRSLFILPGRMCVVSLFVAALICMPANGTQVEAQQTTWSPAGSLATGRFGHTSTLLANGKVLVVGGRLCANSSCTEFGSAELYDPGTGAWSTTGGLGVPRHAHVAVRLPNGKVLVAGGHNGATNWNTAELYDPDTGIWSATGSLTTARAFATATLLPNGKVLVAGGGTGDFLNSAELYDPGNGSWTTTGALSVARGFHTATSLVDGRVLVAAGAALASGILTLQRSAEIYDPATGSWTQTGRLATARVFHTETLLTSGKVLVTGGSNFTSIIYDTAELYDPLTGLWTTTGSLTSPRISHSATLLANGKVLAVAGFNNDPTNSAQRSAELYNPVSETWSSTAELSVLRGNHAATRLSDGKVLVTGGNGGGSPALASAELFDSTTTLPLITGASISGKALFVEGQNFDEGAKVFLNDQPQKTANDTATTLLRCKKAGKQIERGATVRLKVRNSDGTESAEFSFSRTVE